MPIVDNDNETGKPVRGQRNRQAGAGLLSSRLNPGAPILPCLSGRTD